MLQSSFFHTAHKALEIALDGMKRNCDSLLAQDEQQKKKQGGVNQLERVQSKVLKSLSKHWQGLTVFLGNPEVPMDNNKAERPLRGPVSARKGYPGSGSEWSAHLTAMMFSIFQTLSLWNINPKTWLRLYLEACTESDGKPPVDISHFLPWKMEKERLALMAKPP